MDASSEENMEEVSGEGSSLSELNENVLSHIISFLPTRDAIRTSILSKEWKYRWHTIPILCFDDMKGRTKDLVKIVDTSLLRRGPFNVIRFSLHCNWDKVDLNDEGMVDMMSRIHAWTYHLVRCNVQEVELNLRICYRELTLPYRFVNCRTLTSLTIIAPQSFVRLPSTVCLSNLRKLDLRVRGVQDWQHTQKLFSGCPMLEDVRIKECSWDCLKGVSVISPRLQHFTMIEDKLKVTLRVVGGEFLIFSDALKFFHYEGRFDFTFRIQNPKSLEEAHIGLYPCENDLRTPFIKLLRYLSNVKILRFMNVLVYSLSLSL